ncbi:hypothetical protein SAMN04490248_11758 [Salinihabitans flavidus]|uniref:Uncharacterized protein n=1 Tax=Salinihabitans flavidus TaxID=569882 RepID=A0A1H8TZJ5_9RHOB|nr:hypothetical protein [Salinihabitans flavidus]SEO95963.1 hypothetical protein SAMN04490248_11758 [Salinihabitans flavidus]
MGRVFRTLVYLIVIAAVGLVGYAYLGPIFGADFTAPSEEIRVPMTLDAE